MDLKMCRLCGGISHLRVILDQDSEMIRKLLVCANVNIYPGDILPKLICLQCEKNVDLCYHLRMQSEATQSHLMLEIQKRQNDGDNTQELNISNGVTVRNHSESGKIDLTQCSDDSLTEFEEIDSKSTKKEKILGEQEEFLEQNSELSKNKAHKHFNHVNPTAAESIEYNALQKVTENVESNDIQHEKICDARSEFCTSEDSCENRTNEVVEVSTVSESCSIDLLHFKSSTHACHNNAKNDHVGPLLTDSTTFTCETCHENLNTFREYRIHIKQHGLNRYQCIQCCKFFPSKFRLKRHEEIHNEDCSYQCPNCNRQYRALYNLKRHLSSVHVGKRSLECQTCNISFSRNDALKRHLKLHSDKKNFTCSICSKSFKTKEYLVAHSKTHNTPDLDISKVAKRSRKDHFNKHQCNYCGKLFKSSFAYKNHLLIHTNEKPYKCDNCIKHFRTIAALTIHQRIHDDYRPYQCDLCLKSFRQTAHLKEHKSLHLEDIPKHNCSICQAPFAKKSNLKAHMRIHTKEKPFKCADCSAEFSFMYLLQRHAGMVHSRSVHKVYTLNNIEESLKGEESTDINDTVESELYQYIDTVEDNDDGELNTNAEIFVDLIESSQDIPEEEPSGPELDDNPQIEQEVFYVKNCVPENEPIQDYDDTQSTNFMQLQTSGEEFLHQINENEIYMKEEKVDILITEETKLTSSVYSTFEIE